MGDPDGRRGARHAAARLATHRGQMACTADLDRCSRRDAGGRGRIQARRRPVPVRRIPRVDPVVRHRLHPRRRRYRAGAGGSDGRAGAAADHRGLERRQRSDRLGRPIGAHVLRADAGGRGHGADVARLAGRAAVLRVLRGHAHPDVLPHRRVRRREQVEGSGEVPAVQPVWRADHARRGHRPVRGDRARATRSRRAPSTSGRSSPRCRAVSSS